MNGFPIRNINPDFGIIEWRDEDDIAPMYNIPKNHIWIDSRFWDEKAFLLKLYLAEQKYVAEYGINFSDKIFRKKLKREFTWDGPQPTFSDFTIRTKRKGRFLIRFVDGKIIREWIDPWFSFGGHHLVYDYVPPGEIWIDNKQHPRDIKYTIAHEIREWWLMGRGKTYDKAHDMAIEYEKELRIKELIRNKKKS